MSLTLPHRKFPGSILWRLTDAGVAQEGKKEAWRTQGPPTTLQRLWADYGPLAITASNEVRIPVELLLATVATESGGDRYAKREEPGYESDEKTPHRVSFGLCQMLLSTAQDLDPEATRDRLFLPDYSLHLAALFISEQGRQARPEHLTYLDPPLVSAGYNAGGLYREHSSINRWRLRCYPRGTGAHIQRFVAWYGDAVAVIEAAGHIDACTHTDLLSGRA